MLEPAERQFVAAFDRVMRTLDDDLLQQLRLNLIESPPPADATRIKANPFYQAYPRAFRSYVPTTWAITEPIASDLLSDYEFGLLTALIPDHARIDIPAQHARMTWPRLVNLYERLLADPHYREGFLEFFDLLVKHEFPRRGREHFDLYDETKHLMIDDPAVIAKSRARFSDGRVKKMDLHLSVRMINVFLIEVLEFARAFQEPVYGLRYVRHNVPVRSLDREFQAEYVDRYLSEVLHARWGLDRIRLVLNTLSDYDPLPITKDRLVKALHAGAEELVLPIRQRLRRASDHARRVHDAPAPADVRPAAAIEPLVVNMIDAFAPPTPGKKVRGRVRTGTATELPAAPTTTPTPPPGLVDLMNDDERAPYAFTSFTSRTPPRPVSELTTDRTYEFFFFRNSKPVIRRVRFAPEVLAWLNETPTLARSMLNALHTGYAGGTVTGTKRVTVLRSRRHDGPVYEIKFNGTYRALMIHVNQTWQVLKVCTKKDLPRSIEWLTPL